MNQYTPTTEEIIEEWTDGSIDVPESRAQFYRWLAAHDAELRAGVVIGVTEWEYTYMDPENGFPDDFGGLPGQLPWAEEIAAMFPGRGELLKRIPAGSWVPVDQGGMDRRTCE